MLNAKKHRLSIYFQKPRKSGRSRHAPDSTFFFFCILVKQQRRSLASHKKPSLGRNFSLAGRYWCTAVGGINKTYRRYDEWYDSLFAAANLRPPAPRQTWFSFARVYSTTGSENSLLETEADVVLHHVSKIKPHSFEVATWLERRRVGKISGRRYHANALPRPLFSWSLHTEIAELR